MCVFFSWKYYGGYTLNNAVIILLAKDTREGLPDP